MAILLFINHAHRGIPKERLKALTVIHNYDIRRADNSTPAQRLFNKEFPDLFEFLCQYVTGFKEPKQRVWLPPDVAMFTDFLPKIELFFTALE